MNTLIRESEQARLQGPSLLDEVLERRHALIRAGCRSNAGRRFRCSGEGCLHPQPCSFEQQLVRDPHWALI